MVDLTKSNSAYAMHSSKECNVINAVHKINKLVFFAYANQFVGVHCKCN